MVGTPHNVDMRSFLFLQSFRWVILFSFSHMLFEFSQKDRKIRTVFKLTLIYVSVKFVYIQGNSVGVVFMINYV